MDFAAQLANLNQSANAAARRRDRSPTNDHENRRQRPRHGSNPRQNQRHQHSQDPHDNLRRFGYKVDRPPLDLPADPLDRKPHICLLAISIEDLAYEDLWKAWAATGDAHVSLVCHAKHPDRIQSPWLKQRLIVEPPRIGRGNQWADPVPRTHQPAWGSVEILRAMLDIVHDGLLIGTKNEGGSGNQKESEPSGQEKIEGSEGTDVPGSASELKPADEDPRFDPNRYYIALNDDVTPTDIPPADKFIFISETCIPIQSLKACCEALGSPMGATSWVNARNKHTPGTPRNKYELDQFSRIRVVPSCFRWKADQWMLLSRSHAIAVRKLDNHLPEGDRLWKRGFSLINASDEMYFPTVLSILQVLQQSDDSETKDAQEKCAGDKNDPEPDAKQQAREAESAKIGDSSSQVLLRPVTYTDWSEGMKNPATHTKKDLARVTKIAQAQGSLFARKFTGSIDIEEWKRETGIE